MSWNGAKTRELLSVLVMAAMVGTGAVIFALLGLTAAIGGEASILWLVAGIVFCLSGIAARIFMISRNWRTSLLGVFPAVLILIAASILIFPILSIANNFRRYDFSSVSLMFWVAILAVVTKWIGKNYKLETIKTELLVAVFGLIGVVCLNIVGREAAAFIYGGRMRTISMTDQLVWIVICLLVFSIIYTLFNKESIIKK